MATFTLTLLMGATLLATSLSSPVLKETCRTVKENDGGIQTLSVIQLRHLSSVRPLDYFADTIRSILGWSVKELLQKMYEVFQKLDQVTKKGVNAIFEVEKANPDLQPVLSEITTNATSQAFQQFQRYIRDLDSVIPVLSSRYATHESASDIVEAILGKTLEELVKAIWLTLKLSYATLEASIRGLLAINATPSVEAVLNEIADEYFNQGRAIVLPMLDRLSLVVNPNRFSTGATKDLKKVDSDLLNAIVSKMLGTDVEMAANDVSLALSKFVPLMESTREQLKAALHDTIEVETEVLSIYDAAVDDITRDARPIITALHQFDESSRSKNSFVYDLAVSLIGVGMVHFKDYAERTSPRVEALIEKATVEIAAVSEKAGQPVAMQVSTIVDEVLADVRKISEPLLRQLQTILDHEPEYGKSCEGPWSEEDGSTYNRDAIVNAASNLLGFPVSEATKLLETSLENLDELMATSLDELESTLPDSAAYLSKDILEIMNTTLGDIHVTFQPVLDVLLPFLPDGTRPNRQVMTDIFIGSNGVNIDRFNTYCASMAVTIQDLTNSAFYRINEKGATAGPRVHAQIREILTSTERELRHILEPFIDIVSPIISPKSLKS